MIRPEDARMQKLMEAFNDLGLNADELAKIESYLSGEAGEEVVKELSFRNLENTKIEVYRRFSDMTGQMVNKGRYDEFCKVFNVLFTLGQSTCANMMPEYMRIIMSKKENKEKIVVDRAKIAAVYAQSMASIVWHYNAYQFEEIFEMAGSDPENVKKAIDYYKGSTSNGKLLLLATYFWRKYPKISGSSTMIEQEDVALMQEYETIIAHNVDMLLYGNRVSSNNATTTELKRMLIEALPKEEMPKQLLEQIKNVSLDDSMLKLLGGCAYLNCMLSNVLKNFVIICASVDAKKTLDMFVEMDARRFLNSHGGAFDTIFSIPAKKLIWWAAEWKTQNRNIWTGRVDDKMPYNILRMQFSRNREAFLEYKEGASYFGNERMMEVVKELEPGLHQMMINNGAVKQREKVIDYLTSGIASKDQCVAYLTGEAHISSLYAMEDSLKASRYVGYDRWEIVNAYNNIYNDNDFFNRCVAFVALREMTYFFTRPLTDSNNDKEFGQVALRFFNSMNAGGLDYGHQLHTITYICDLLYNDKDKTSLFDSLKPLFLQYLRETHDEAMEAFINAEALGRYFGLCVMEDESEDYKEDILKFCKDTAKLVKEKLESILKSKPEWRADITSLLASKKGAERELAIRVMSHWNTPEDIEALQKLLETEKNSKIRNMLAGVLQTEGDESGSVAGDKAFTKDELVKNLHKGGKKRGIAWAYETPFSEVHKKSGELADEEYLQAVLLCYTSMNQPGVSADAKLLAEDLDEAELAVYVNELFDKWLESGAEAKKRWVMYASSIHGGSDIVKKLYHQIQEWPQYARGAIAADAVQALALNPQPQALLIVDSIAGKFKFKQVRAAAGKALEFAASQLGMTREELEDKIVPNLGFDDNMERVFDYGERKFTVTITTALEIEVYGEDGKKLKNLPAPGKKDDEEKATAAYAAFKEMKKQMKAVVTSQKKRLELALSSERLWSVEAWKELFVKNPVMHQFAIGLIWGIYEEHNLIQSFRYMEDGSFNTEDEDEYTMPDGGYIGLVHPIELTQESKEAWKQQLDDYEITQPIDQLNREVFYLNEDETEQSRLERFGGMVVNDLSLNGKLLQLGWYRGSVQDAGCFYTFYREETSLGLGVELHFSGTYVGCGNEDVTVYDARFYEAGTIQRGSYMYDEVEGDKCIPLSKIPERYFSEIVLQLTKATASSSERDENWKSQITN